MVDEPIVVRLSSSIMVLLTCLPEREEAKTREREEIAKENPRLVQAQKETCRTSFLRYSKRVKTSI